MTKLEKDVREFLEENPRIARLHEGYESLTWEEKLDCYLSWNGVVDWTNTLVNVFKELGWTPPESR